MHRNKTKSYFAGEERRDGVEVWSCVGGLHMHRNKTKSYFAGEERGDGVEVWSCVGDQGYSAAEQV